MCGLDSAHLAMVELAEAGVHVTIVGATMLTADSKAAWSQTRWIKERSSEDLMKTKSDNTANYDKFYESPGDHEQETMRLDAG